MIYADWIDGYVARFPYGVRGKCAEATREMCEAFPELRRAAGIVQTSWGVEQHWWCVSPAGEIVDPTASQFKALFGYEELDLNNPADAERVPTGVCYWCGEQVYKGREVCSDACGEAAAGELNRGASKSCA